jgi:hypothetical protein
MVDDVVVGREDVVGEPVVAHELSDVVDRVQLGTFGRQRDDADIAGHLEFVGGVPSTMNCAPSPDFGHRRVHPITKLFDQL